MLNKKLITSLAALVAAFSISACSFSFEVAKPSSSEETALVTEFFEEETSAEDTVAVTIPDIVDEETAAEMTPSETTAAETQTVETASNWLAWSGDYGIVTLQNADIILGITTLNGVSNKCGIEVLDADAEISPSGSYTCFDTNYWVEFTVINNTNETMPIKSCPINAVMIFYGGYDFSYNGLTAASGYDDFEALLGAAQDIDDDGYYWYTKDGSEISLLNFEGSQLLYVELAR